MDACTAAVSDATPPSSRARHIAKSWGMNFIEDVDPFVERICLMAGRTIDFYDLRDFSDSKLFFLGAPGSTFGSPADRRLLICRQGVGDLAADGLKRHRATTRLEQARLCVDEGHTLVLLAHAL